MSKTALQVDHLGKQYGDVVAVDEISFEVSAGEIFGLLGPNGAGKTTTIGCVCGLLKPGKGKVCVSGIEAGIESTASRKRLGVVPQDLALYDELTVGQNLSCFGAIFGISGKPLVQRMDWCLEFSQLAEYKGRKVSELSGGMKRRLNLAVGLIHDPELVLADEPTVGVDPQSRNHIFENMEALARAGKAVVYTTHYMEEVERLCQRAAIMDRGKIVAMDTLPELLTMAGDTRRVRMGWTGGIPGEKVRNQLKEKFAAESISVEGAELHLSFRGQVPVTGMVKWLDEAGYPVSELSMERPTLEDAFLRLTGRSLRDH